MLTVIVIVKTLVFIAGFTLLGQGVLWVLAGAGRETNVFYRMIRAITSPATKLVRLITPRALVPDAYIGAAAFFLMAGIYFALVVEQRDQCVRDMQHFACERLVAEYEQQCVGGNDDACRRLGRAAGIIPPATKP